MSKKRRDKKNRVLRNGESLRSDGRYQYKYVDTNGRVLFLYSWKLESTDKLPAGKRECVALRDQIAEIRRVLSSGLAVNGGDMTVLQLVERYTALKTGVKESTKAGYKTTINFLKKNAFGNKRINKVRISDAKLWLIGLQEDGKSYSAIHSLRGVLRPAFQMAMDDDLIRKNPFEFQLATVIVNDSVTREAITRKQEQDFLEFVRQDKHFSKYYDGIYILFKTGMRISEFAGLTLADIDLKNRTIDINHQLQRTSDMRYIIEDTKTDAGTRVIPMTDDVYDCFVRIVRNRKKLKIEPMIGGRTGFLFFDKNDRPMVAMHWEKYFQHICQKYNKIYKVQMPKVTPHVCRHTYCSNMARSGMNPKNLQYLMGHSEIGITLNTYTHLGLEDAKTEMQRIKVCANQGKSK